MLGSLRKLGKIFTPLARLANKRVSPPDTSPKSITAPNPTIFHITHHKAGSQWINRIFHALAYDRLVMPKVNGTEFNIQFLTEPLIAGKIYPTLYVTKQQFESVELPPNSKHFVVIRDLRDTLISGYFSIKHSHEMNVTEHQQMRSRLQDLAIEDGLLYLLDTWYGDPAAASPPAIQRSWIGGTNHITRYEDLLVQDERILEHVLIDQCGVGVSRERLREVVLTNRFETRAGRNRGEENVASHERKGIAGDWQNYFSDRLSKIFKDRYGELLIAAGHEKDARW